MVHQVENGASVHKREAEGGRAVPDNNSAENRWVFVHRSCVFQVSENGKRGMKVITGVFQEGLKKSDLWSTWQFAVT